MVTDNIKAVKRSEIITELRSAETIEIINIKKAPTALNIEINIEYLRNAFQNLVF